MPTSHLVNAVHRTIQYLRSGVPYHVTQGHREAPRHNTENARKVFFHVKFQHATLCLHFPQHLRLLHDGLQVLARALVCPRSHGLANRDAVSTLRKHKGGQMP